MKNQREFCRLTRIKRIVYIIEQMCLFGYDLTTFLNGFSTMTDKHLLGFYLHLKEVNDQ